MVAPIDKVENVSHIHVAVHYVPLIVINTLIIIQRALCLPNVVQLLAPAAEDARHILVHKPGSQPARSC